MDIRPFVAAVAFIVSGAGPAQAQDPTFSTATLTTEAAYTVARAALDSCRDSGFQVAVSVTDRSGTPIALLRDRFAGAHTPETATRKAYTAASFNMHTTDLADATQSGTEASGIRQVTGVLALGGGLPINAAGSLVGAVGVSGAPGGQADEDCARDGIDAIQDDLDF
ncbi:MAG TPA: heme-binding protein [Burkholderiaceae bacterium]|nr:heme-binding protein [Burkholderiaceae bacterium]